VQLIVVCRLVWSHDVDLVHALHIVAGVWCPA
jgi:hypothetical protein